MSNFVGGHLGTSMLRCVCIINFHSPHISQPSETIMADMALRLLAIGTHWISFCSLLNGAAVYESSIDMSL